MGEVSVADNGLVWVNVPLDALDAARFEAVQRYYGIKNRTDVVRFLVRKEVRELRLMVKQEEVGHAVS